MCYGVVYLCMLTTLHIAIKRHLVKIQGAFCFGLISKTSKKEGGFKMRKLYLRKVGQIVLLLFIVGLFTSMLAFAQDETPVMYQGSFTVTNDGGKFQVGFVEIHFKKDSLPDGIDSITFNGQIYAENGVVYIEFTPDAKFKKDVQLHCEGYEGYIYDKSAGKNIYVELKKQTLKADHFSRFAWIR